MPWRQLLPVDRIHPNPDNPRAEAGDVTDLANSIREQGLLQPIIVRPAPDKGDGHYYIEAGYRRWVAMKSWNTLIPAAIRPPLPGENPAMRNIVTGLVENIHRKDLGPMEKARAFGRLRDEFKLTNAQIGKQTGLSESSVSRFTSLLELAPAAQERVASGKLQVGQAMNAVQLVRAQRRRREGSAQAGAQWEPEWFTVKHPLAQDAARLCERRRNSNPQHAARRRLGKTAGYAGACGQCWESEIRRDERIVDEKNAQEGPKFIAP